MKSKKAKEKKPLTPEQQMKYDIAAELGLTEKIQESGWEGLTAAETGRIGGIINTRRKGQKKEDLS